MSTTTGSAGASTPTRVAPSIEELEAMSASVRFALVKSSVFSADEQEALLAAEYHLEALAGNEHLTLSSQKSLARQEWPVTREHLAFNENVLPSVQSVLAADKDTDVRAALAGNARVSSALQRVLARDSDWLVRMNLASNEALIAALQPLLVRDADRSVREYLGRRRDLAPELVATLAADQEACVREAVAANPSVELSAAFPLACLELSDRGRALVQWVVSQASIGGEVLDVLRWGWTGTLTELVETSEEFAPGEDLDKDLSKT
jgi:hypothetical protein